MKLPKESLCGLIQKLGIQNNDVVMVHNKRGKFLAGVVTTDRMRENVICVHKGAWIKYAKLSKNMNKTWKIASSIFSERCLMCHTLPKSTKFTANQWPPTLKVMAKRAALDKKQTDLVSEFLQYHAKGIAK